MAYIVSLPIFGTIGCYCYGPDHLYFVMNLLLLKKLNSKSSFHFYFLCTDDHAFN